MNENGNGQPGQSNGQVVQPLASDVVTFYGHDIRAVRLPDGSIAAVLTDLCTALDLDRASQARRIRTDDVLADHLLFALVADNLTGETQAMDVLAAWGIPLWLTGVRTGKLTAEKRAAIRAFRREAADVLYRHFSQPRAELPTPVNLVPADPITQPEAPGEGAPLSAWRAYHQGMLAYIDWQADIERWRGSVESRLESVEEITRLVPEILDRLGPQTLTPEHQATVKASARRLSELTGSAYATIYGELNEAFHVGKYSDIAENEWLRVASWFRARIAAAEQRRQR
ncbi:MAG: hypothetical protein OJF49_002342 [Ktedonobacterales bacterium]|nr:MAG: hypothetical protein OJF49_002342 [Ktedonobacterales bacterium]